MPLNFLVTFMNYFVLGKANVVQSVAKSSTFKESLVLYICKSETRFGQLVLSYSPDSRLLPDTRKSWPIP